jgi:hypothetical protein
MVVAMGKVVNCPKMQSLLSSMKKNGIAPSVEPYKSISVMSLSEVLPWESRVGI